MLSVTIMIRGAEFAARMVEIGGWLRANRWEPNTYKSHHHEDAVLVILDFPAEMAAEAFATRFNGVYGSSPEDVIQHAAVGRVGHGNLSSIIAGDAQSGSGHS
jgi:hypothetical protein